MRAFTCPSCANELWFDSLVCERCAVAVAYDVDDDRFVEAKAPCSNRTTAEGCNWQTSRTEPWCPSCRLDLDHEPTARRRPFQQAKRRSLRQLRRSDVDPDQRRPPLRFDLRPGTPEQPVVTGHDDGVITLDTAEGEPSHRERVRVELGEPYRTPLGHVRHELGHWWWATAIDRELDRGAFRSSFGDERADYPGALRAHYATPDDGSWRDRFISHYAASHPWEDFAESFAHVLHIGDALETATARGLVDPVEGDGFAAAHAAWVPLTLALNELNRSMGTPDPYPFAPPPPAVDKLALVAASLPQPARW